MKKLIKYRMIAISFMVLTLGFAAQGSQAQTIVPGVDLRGGGPNLAGPSDPPNTFVKCALTLGGVPVGYQRSVNNGDGTASHTISVVGGQLLLKLDNSTGDITMKDFDSTFAADAFPEASAYRGVITRDSSGAIISGAQIWYADGNISKGDAGVESWVGTGTLSKITHIEIRCVYLVVFTNGIPRVVKCMGCHYYIS